MARFYRLWSNIRRGTTPIFMPSCRRNFATGEHGTLCLNYDAEAWFAPPDGHSGPLAQKNAFSPAGAGR